MNKLNNMTKVAILVLYAGILFLLSFLIINGANKNVKRFTVYSETPYNDDIAVNAQVIEVRKSKEENQNGYEYSKFDVYLYLTKKASGEITNIYSYLCSESGRKYSYSQTTTSKSMKESTYTSSTTSFLNSSTAFAYIQVNTDDKGKVVSIDNLKPETIYIKVAYDIVYENTEETVSHELNYKFNIEKINFKNFDKYEQRSIGATYIEGKDDIFRVKFYRTITEATDDEPEFENYKLSILEVDADKIAAGVTIDKMDLTVYGRISNKDMISNKNFDEYVRLFTYNGSLNRGVRTIRTSSISKKYGIDRIYFTANIVLRNIEDGTTSKTVTTFYIEASDLTNS